jgi:hypothetical protein
LLTLALLALCWWGKQTTKEIADEKRNLQSDGGEFVPNIGKPILLLRGQCQSVFSIGDAQLPGYSLKLINNFIDFSLCHLVTHSPILRPPSHHAHLRLRLFQFRLQLAGAPAVINCGNWDRPGTREGRCPAQKQGRRKTVEK